MEKQRRIGLNKKQDCEIGHTTYYRNNADIWSAKLVQLAATEHNTTLKPDAFLAHQMRYLQVPEMREVTQRHIAEQFKADFIELSNSEWDCSVVHAPRKDGTLRL